MQSVNKVRKECIRVLLENFIPWVLCAIPCLCSPIFTCRKTASLKLWLLYFKNAFFFSFKSYFLLVLGPSWPSPASFFTFQCQQDLTIICIYNLLLWRMWTSASKSGRTSDSFKPSTSIHFIFERLIVKSAPQILSIFKVILLLYVFLICETFLPNFFN